MRPINTSDLCQRISDEACLGSKLRFVAQVLELATAAFAIISARSYSPVDGWLDDLNNRCSGKVFLDLDDFRVQDVARRGQWHKHDESLVPRDTFAAEGQAVYLDSNDAPN